MNTFRDIGIFNQDPDRLTAPEEEVVALFAELDKIGWATVPEGELSVALVDAATISQLHADFMDDPTPTDVITFPGDEEGFAGEICACFDTAAKEHGGNDTAFDEELTLYLVHGWLHLAGYDDRAAADRKAMRKAEARAMAHLRGRCAIPAFRLK